jgi:hypothetical protein
MRTPSLYSQDDPISAALKTFSTRSKPNRVHILFSLVHDEKGDARYTALQGIKDNEAISHASVENVYKVEYSIARII